MIRRYAVAAAPSARSVRWPALEPAPTWPEFVAWLGLDSPAAHKDCGGYVAGQLVCARRGRDTVLSRSMLVLDADAASSSFLLDAELVLAGCAGVAHTTWSHRTERPRYRLVLPLSRDCTPDEYRLLARFVMHEIGPDQFDSGSTQPERLMYRPAAAARDDYHYAVWSGDPLDVDVWIVRALAELDDAAAVDVGATPEAAYSGPAYAALSPGEQELADAYVAGVVAWWRAKWATVVEWPEGQRDEKGRGWEAHARDCAWALARVVVHPWTGLTAEQAAGLYASVVPDEVESAVGSKWSDDLVGLATSAGDVGGPPWRSTDFAPVVVRTCDVTNPASALSWLLNEMGTDGLAGMFQRGADIVYTPRVGESGYVPPRIATDDDGPAQMRRIDGLELAARVDVGYLVTRRSQRGTPTPSLFPAETAQRTLRLADMCPNLRLLSGITHTPTVRADGTVVTVPGYDDASGVLYLPTGGAPHVPDSPSAEDVERAGKLLLDLTADFPWVTSHDRANYLGLLLTPLLRAVVPPPYKMCVITAPQRGSGKSLLASVARRVHGGVFKSEFPVGAEEQRKVITALLDTTSAPLVQFDNVTGVLRSSVLDGMLTSPVWVDRILGASRSVQLPNDRVWVVTGNNVKIGGDLGRRTLWINIDADMEHPETRSSFRIPHLEEWVLARREELLTALLTLVRAWVCAGRPTEARTTTDSFGDWVACLRGILGVAELGEAVGVVDHADTAQVEADSEEMEWAGFLAAVHRALGSEEWSVRQLIESVGWDGDASIHEDELPGDLYEKWARSRVGAGKSLGRWLMNRDGRWAGGYSVRQAGRSSHKNTVLWRVIQRD